MRTPKFDFYVGGDSASLKKEFIYFVVPVCCERCNVEGEKIFRPNSKEDWNLTLTEIEREVRKTLEEVGSICPVCKKEMQDNPSENN